LSGERSVRKGSVSGASREGRKEGLERLVIDIPDRWDKNRTKRKGAGHRERERDKKAQPWWRARGKKRHRSTRIE